MSFVATREALHRLACYVIAPARLARAGEIGLVATAGGFGTPPLPDGTAITVDGAELVDGDRRSPITTLRDAAAFVGVGLTATPDVGSDLPPFDPDAPLEVDEAAAHSLGEWFALATTVLTGLTVPSGTVDAPTLWPEHFDLAVTVMLPGDVGVNVGFSAGDATSAEPYAYVGPWDRTGLDRRVLERPVRRAAHAARARRPRRLRASRARPRPGPRRGLTSPGKPEEALWTICTSVMATWSTGPVRRADRPASP